MPRVRRTPPPGARPNRTDMNVPKVPTGLPYGEAGKLAAAQSAVPVPTQAAGGGAPDWQQLAAAAQAHPTDQVVGLNEPTQRPDEPIQAGLPMGMGAGPDFNIARNDPTLDILTRLEAFYTRWPTPQLRSMIEEVRRG